MITLIGIIIWILICTAIVAAIRPYEIWRRKTNPQYTTGNVTRGFISIFIFILMVITTNITNSLSVKPKTIVSVHELLSMLAIDINKKNPQKLDALTTLQKVQAEGERGLVYIFSISADAEQYDFSISASGVKEVNKNWCDSKALKYVRELNAEIIYRYNDEKGNLIKNVTINTQDCSK